MQTDVSPEAEAHYARMGFGARAGVGVAPALLVIDVTQPFFEAGSPMACPVPDMRPGLKSLLTLARTSEWPVIFTTLSFRTLAGWRNSWMEKLPILDLLTSEDAEAFPDWAMPRPDEFVLNKMAPSAFHGTPLLSVLIPQRVDTLIIAGAAVSGCVRASVVDAVSFGYRVVVATDAASDRRQDVLDVNLFDVNAKYADLHTVAEIKEALRMTAGGQLTAERDLPTAEDFLDLRQITKRFGGVTVVDAVGMTIKVGEIHGLVGENGSGKSTLIKILSGYHTPDSGALFVEGKEVPFPLSGSDLGRLGLAFVHQDLGLSEDLTVLDNFLLPSLVGGVRRIRWGEERQQLSARLERYDLQLDSRTVVHELTPTQRAMVAIVRAVSLLESAERKTGDRRGLLVLDETTVFLPLEEKENLYRLMRRVASEGYSILFVSHDLDEVREVTDRLTVLRDGVCQGTHDPNALTAAQLIELIVGRGVDTSPLSGSNEDAGEFVLTTHDVVIEGIPLPDMSVRSGEVVGLAGLPGTGYDRLNAAIFGAILAEDGMVRILGEPSELSHARPKDAIRKGVGYLPPDRQHQSGAQELSLTDNVMTLDLDRYFRSGVLRRKASKEEARRRLEAFDVRPPRPNAILNTLSGGNQQKAIISKWASAKPKLWLIDEPTQGVDVGARQRIVEAIRSMCHQGAAVTCASNDHEQLAQVCDRVLVFGTGTKIVELVRPYITKQKISEACFTLADSHELLKGVEIEHEKY